MQVQYLIDKAVNCCRSAATANWLLQLQTGYMLPLLGKLLLLWLATGYSYLLLLLLLLVGRLDKSWYIRSLARNASSKSIKPHKASLLTCLRCRISDANDAPVKLTQHSGFISVFCHLPLLLLDSCNALEDSNLPHCQVQVLSTTWWQ